MIILIIKNIIPVIGDKITKSVSYYNELLMRDVESLKSKKPIMTDDIKNYTVLCTSFAMINYEWDISYMDTIKLSLEYFSNKYDRSSNSNDKSKGKISTIRGVKNELEILLKNMKKGKPGKSEKSNKSDKTVKGGYEYLMGKVGGKIVNEVEYVIGGKTFIGGSLLNEASQRFNIHNALGDGEETTLKKLISEIGIDKAYKNYLEKYNEVLSNYLELQSSKYGVEVKSLNDMDIEIVMNAINDEFDNLKDAESPFEIGDFRHLFVRKEFKDFDLNGGPVFDDKVITNKSEFIKDNNDFLTSLETKFMDSSKDVHDKTLKLIEFTSPDKLDTCIKHVVHNAIVYLRACLMVKLANVRFNMSTDEIQKLEIKLKALQTEMKFYKPLYSNKLDNIEELSSQL